MTSNDKMAQIRYSYGKMNKNDRSFQMSKQEAIIEQKKREIEQKLLAKKRKEEEEMAKKLIQKAKKIDFEGSKSR